MTKEIVLPDLGEGIDNAEISEVPVKPGDTIGADDIIIVLESDKATMEIPAETEGVVKKVHVKPNDVVSAGSLLISLEVAEEKEKSPVEKTPVKEKPTEPPAPPVKDPAPVVETPDVTEPVSSAPVPPPPSTGLPPLASPSVRKFARELGCDLSEVKGSGPKGRIIREDVQNFIKWRLSQPAGGSPAPVLPVEDFAKWGPVENQPVSRIKKISGQRLQAAWQTIPHVTQYDKADITDLNNFRKSLQLSAGKKISFLPFLMKAVVKVLQEMPVINSSLDASGESLVLKKYYHIGIAVDTPHGLVVPVIRDVDQKGLGELVDELTEKSELARNRKLKPEDFQGGTFTISSLGGIGGTGFSPIVNPPQVAILGVSRAEHQPVFDGSEFVPRYILPYSLSYDHRVVDGADAVRFTSRLAKILSDLSQLPDLKLL